MRTGAAQMTLEAALSGFRAGDPDWRGLAALQLREKPFALLFFGCGAVDVLQRVPAGMVYLATPYSLEVVGPDGVWCAARSHDAAQRSAVEAARLAGLGVTAISPVVLSAAMCGPFRSALDPLDAGFWEGWCRPLLMASRGVAVPALRGWARSRGVWAEVLFGLRRQMPVLVYATAEEIGDG